MISKVYPFGTLKSYKYVVVLSRCEGRILLSRHRARTTWETQGGHVEQGETPLQAARRELWEESGAVEYDIRPLCDYWAGDETSGANGAVFAAEIRRLGPLPQSEMAEVRTFDTLPENLTYPAIALKLFARLWEDEQREGMEPCRS
ncbi:MAG: NUDIX domain-containing protein [Clostridia bacterium]|nr:NUDIX domain-containing protein [Clostridia bacterium]